MVEWWLCCWLISWGNGFGGGSYFKLMAAIWNDLMVLARVVSYKLNQQIRQQLSQMC